MACGGTPPAQTPRAAIDASTVAIDGNVRFGKSVVPTRYDLDLTIDPESDRFSGRASIEIDVRESVSLVALHALELSFESVAVEAAGGPRRVVVRPGSNGAVGLEIAPPLEPGPATLRFVWNAPLPISPFGIYRVEDGGRWYVFTQFEPLEARKAFPGFDQPEWKTPFRVTLRVPRGQLALSNGPQVEQRVEGDLDVFVFAQTRPLPTYLVAFAVGPLASRESPAKSGTVRARIVSTPEKIALTDYAAERTPVVLDWLTDYFAHPYPFAKLDMVAVPNFGAGAMENVGLVTFRERLLLLDPERAPVWDRRSSQSVIAHELAHMWYGNLVTMAWWDDLWLNESFASWMATKVLEDIAPELEVGLRAIAGKQHTMALDAKRDARQIRQPILDAGDIYNAFDGITYGKGAAVLGMVEAWLGEDVFRAGVRSYMKQHAYASGGTDELLAALTQASGRPVAETLRLFLDQPGTPLVEASLSCDPGGNERPQLRLRQTRYRPLGSDASVGQPWTIPLCVAYESEQAGGRAGECWLLREADQRVELSKAGGQCPSWLHPNAEERGYYRFSLPREDLLALATRHRGQLTIAERVGLPGLFQALVEAGALPVEIHAEALAGLAQEHHPQIVQGVVDALWSLHAAAVGPDSGDDFARWVRELLAPALDRVGLEPVAGESVEDQLSRKTLVPVLGELGEDPQVRKRAESVADAFLESPSSVSEEMLGLYLPLAARRGDVRLWQGLVEAIAGPLSPATRAIAVRALGSFEDPALLRASLGLVLDGRLRAQDYRTLAWRIREGNLPDAFAWLRENYAVLVAMLSPMTRSDLPGLTSGMCTAADTDRVARFFAEVEGAPAGTDRNVRLAREDIELCITLRAALAPPLRAYLSRHDPKH